MWIFAAILSAIFAGLTSILAKCGIRKTGSDLAMALRTIVVLLFSIIMVYVVGSQSQITMISTKSWIFLVLSGLATGASWICYFKALSLGDVNKVATIDKSSTVITVLIAIFLFNETDNLFNKIIGTALIGIGTYLMIDKKNIDMKKSDSSWVIYASLSAVFASLTSILAKIGIENVDSNLGTAIRTVIILLMAWLVVFMKGGVRKLGGINLNEIWFIVLSGLATGASWLCYYYAIQKGIVSIVVPIDKMSILITVIFSIVFLKERISRKSILGLGLICFGTLIMIITF